MTIDAHERVISDPLMLPITESELIDVSFYLKDFTLMRSVVYTSGPLSEGLYANGDETENAKIDRDTSRTTSLRYFLSTAAVDQSSTVSSRI